MVLKARFTKRKIFDKNSSLYFFDINFGLTKMSDNWFQFFGALSMICHNSRFLIFLIFKSIVTWVKKYMIGKKLAKHFTEVTYICFKSYKSRASIKFYSQKKKFVRNLRIFCNIFHFQSPQHQHNNFLSLFHPAHVIIFSTSDIGFPNFYQKLVFPATIFKSRFFSTKFETSARKGNAVVSIKK